MKKVGVYLAVFLFIISCVFAAENLKLSVSSLQDKVEAGKEADFKVHIVNNGIRDDFFKIYVDDLSVYPFSDFAEKVIIEPNQLNIKSHEGQDVLVKVKILSTTKANINHILTLKARSLTNTEMNAEDKLSIFVLSPQQVVNILPIIPRDIEPGKSFDATVNYGNRVNEQLDNLKVLISGVFFSESDDISLMPYENISKDYRINIRSSVEPGDYVFSLRVYQDKELKGEYSSKVRVGASSLIKENKKVSKGILSQVITLTEINQGNVLASKKITYPAKLFDKLYLFIEPDTNKIDNNYVWDITLKPDEIYNIRINKDYKPIIIVLIIVILFIWILNYLFGKHVVVKKKILKIKHDEKTSELKVLVNVRNRGSELKNVKVIDIIPSFMKPGDEFGTLKPDKIQRGVMGLRFIWNIDSLQRGEERVLSYLVHYKLPVIGKIVLPAAFVQYAKNDRVFGVKSNKLIVRKK
jgi:archaellum component FlaF (FlaF/FlaG flagellin family)